MSNISGTTNRHQFQPLMKSSKPLSGQRMVRIIAKQNRDGGYDSQNLTKSYCVSVPPIAHNDVADAIDKLVPHIVSMLESAQDQIIREYRIETGNDSIDESLFDVNSCIAFLDQSERGNRLTTEYLQQWFVENYSEAATEFICLMNKWTVEDLSEEQAKICEQKGNILRDFFSGFASARYSPDIPKCKAIMKFTEFVGAEADSRLSAFAARAAKIRAVKEAEMSIDALGF